MGTHITGNYRKFVLLLALLMTLTSLLFGCKWANEKTIREGSYLNSGSFRFKAKADGTLELTRYDGDDLVVEIPETVKGRDVTAIGKGAFHRAERFAAEQGLPFQPMTFEG